MYLSKIFSKTMDAYLSGQYSIISNCGGTRSGKTYSIMQFLYLFCCNTKKSNLVISVVSRTLPHLKRGALRDFQNILEENQNLGLVDVNKTDRIYYFPNNNRIEFWSADDTGKLHGAQRDMLFINEANYISREKIKQLFVRTSGVKLIDYNPSSVASWIDDYRNREDFIEIHSTYKDNDFLSKEQVLEIESNRNDKRWWSIYGEGVAFVSEGLCYQDVYFGERHNYSHPTYGIDFGFHDPTACVKLEIDGDDIFVEECFYATGLDIADIEDRLAKSGIERGKDLIIADNASPQIIQQLKNDGYFIKPCIKGKNSVFDGIQLANKYRIHVTGGNNLKREFQTYSYEEDMDGNYTDVPQDCNNHSLDAFRYVVMYLRNKPSGNYSYSIV